jgi:ElaB/YqjD/DUF883 family membrane-anchored ribosome-binding protein
MDQQRSKDVVSETAAKVEDKVSDLSAKTGKIVQDQIDQGRQGLQASAGEAIDKAAELARKASAAGVEAVSQASAAIQGAAKDVGNQASQAATAVYEQGAQAKGYVSRYAAEQPLSALLIAGAIGYGIAYLVHRSTSPGN